MRPLLGLHKTFVIGTDLNFQAANFPPPDILNLKDSLFAGSPDVTPFARGTAIFNAVKAGETPAKCYVVKISWVSDSRAGREGLALCRLLDHSVPNVPTLVYAFSSNRLSSQFRDFPNSPSQRHLTIIVVTLPSRCTRLIDVPLSFPSLLERFATLIKTLQLCEAAKVRHRDISTGNLLVTDQQDGHRLILNDLDCSTILDTPPPPSLSSPTARTGTLDTASIAVLMSGHNLGFRHLAFHDLESSFYTLVKVLVERLPIVFEGKPTLFGNSGASNAEVIVARQQLWLKDGFYLRDEIESSLVKAGLGSVLLLLRGIWRIKEQIVHGPGVREPEDGAEYRLAAEALAEVFGTQVVLTSEEARALEKYWTQPRTS